MRATLQGAPGSQRHLEQNRVATRAWFEDHFPELVLVPDRFVRDRLLRVSQTVPQPSSVCIPIAQRAAPIPPSAQWRCEQNHLLAWVLDPTPKPPTIVWLPS